MLGCVFRWHSQVGVWEQLRQSLMGRCFQGRSGGGIGALFEMYRLDWSSILRACSLDLVPCGSVLAVREEQVVSTPGDGEVGRTRA